MPWPVRCEREDPFDSAGFASESSGGVERDDKGEHPTQAKTGLEWATCQQAVTRLHNKDRPARISKLGKAYNSDAERFTRQRLRVSEAERAPPKAA
jgi:hypothetical protein